MNCLIFVNLLLLSSLFLRRYSPTNEGLISDFLQNIHEMQFYLEEQKTTNVKLLLGEKLHQVFSLCFLYWKSLGKLSNESSLTITTKAKTLRSTCQTASLALVSKSLSSYRFLRPWKLINFLQNFVCGFWQILSHRRWVYFSSELGHHIISSKRKRLRENIQWKDRLFKKYVGVKFGQLKTKWKNSSTVGGLFGIQSSEARSTAIDLTKIVLPDCWGFRCITWCCECDTLATKFQKLSSEANCPAWA